MITIPGLSQPLKAAGKRITSWAEDSSGLTVEAESTVRGAACPRCSKRSCRRTYSRGSLTPPASGSA
jgi:hypothetical protein